MSSGSFIRSNIAATVLFLVLSQWLFGCVPKGDEKLGNIRDELKESIETNNLKRFSDTVQGDEYWDYVHVDDRLYFYKGYDSFCRGDDEQSGRIFSLLIGRGHKDTNYQVFNRKKASVRQLLEGEKASICHSGYLEQKVVDGSQGKEDGAEVEYRVVKQSLQAGEPEKKPADCGSGALIQLDMFSNCENVKRAISQIQKSGCELKPHGMKVHKVLLSEQAHGAVEEKYSYALVYCKTENEPFTCRKFIPFAHESKGEVDADKGCRNVIQ